MGEGECEPLPDEQPKKSRHRKKHLYNTILQQMEFYFSDSNLTKDRFLSQLISQNQYVDVELFLKFNKIRKLNCTVEDIQKAIRKSDIIELSEDGQKISRKKPIKIKENVDACTIYLENIKADATHETLSQIFSDFGTVVYVSIPKYKHNKANKGFAFIEYETEEQAKEAISFFESIGCKISLQKNPEELQSIATFEGDGTNTFSQEDNIKEEKTENPSESSKKRKNSSEESVQHKKLKVEDDNAIGGTQADVVDEMEGKKKKNKKEKRKNFIKDLGMQVLSKQEWKKLRNRYLDLQKKKMKEFKQYLNRQKFSQKNYDKKKSQPEEKDVKDSKENEEVIEEVKKLSYIPGVIVKLKLPEPCIDVKKLKTEIKSASPEVQYVDVPLPAGSEEVFIRFNANEAAKTFCNKESYGEKVVIEGEEEKNYWEKIENDRIVKFKKLSKKQRGREKLLKKAEKESAKHLRFDENDLS